MGEAKRRKAYQTLDGGPPSDNTHLVLDLVIFPPFEALFSGDHRKLQCTVEWYKRSSTHPTPLCAACDYEFALGEPPAFLFFSKPFIPKADTFTSISGPICHHCARKSHEQLLHAIASYWKRFNPSVHVVTTARA